MVAAEFEEKQYELAANIELARWTGGPRVYASGQVLESVVGYDAVAHPGTGHPLWRVLGAPRPRGVRLLPSLWHQQPSAKALPRRNVSLVLQYKRPDYLPGNRWSTQRPLWGGQPYFRFRTEAAQHGVLRHFEQQVGKAALVRYAAPAFWTLTELDVRSHAREVLSRSGFVSPLSLRRHTVWTYAEPGVEGKGNPDGEAIGFETFEALAARTPDASADPRTPGLAEHLGALARAARATLEEWHPGLLQAVDDWGRGLSAHVPGLEGGAIEGLRDVALVQSLVASTDSTWVLLGWPEVTS